MPKLPKGWDTIGAKVKITKTAQVGYVAWAGVTGKNGTKPLMDKYPDRKFVGVVVETADGLNDGSVPDKGRFFYCAKKQGVMARAVGIEVLDPTPVGLAFVKEQEAIGKSKERGSSSPTRKAKEKAVKSPPPAAKPAVEAAPAPSPVEELPSPPPESESTTPSPPEPAAAPAPTVAPPTPVRAPATPAATPSLHVSASAGERDRIRQLEDCAREDKKIIAELQNWVEELQAEIAVLEATGGGGGGGAAPLNEGDLAAENEALKSALAVLKEAYDIQTTTVAKKEEELREALNPSGGTSGESLSDLKRMVEHLSDREHELLEEKRKADNEIHELQNVLAVAKAIEEESLTWVDELKAELEAANHELGKRDAAVDDLKDEWKQKWLKLNRAYARLEEEVREARENAPPTVFAGPLAANTVNDAPANDINANDVNDVNDAAPRGGGGGGGGYLSVKERAAGLETALKTAEASLLTEKLAMLELFLPQAYQTSEKYGVEMVLFLKRVREKCRIIRADATREYKLDQEVTYRVNTSGLSVYQLAAGQTLACHVGTIVAATSALVSVMEQGHGPVYHSLAHSYIDLQGHETALDALFELLKVDGFGPDTDLSKLVDAAAAFEHTAQSYLKDDVESSSKDFLADFVEGLRDNMSSTALEIKRLEGIFSATTADGGKDPTFDPTLDRLVAAAEACGAVAELGSTAAHHMAPPDDDRVLSIDPKTRDALRTVLGDAAAAAAAVRATSAAAWNDMHSDAIPKALRLDAAYRIAKGCKLDLTEDGRHLAMAAEQADKDAMPVYLPQALPTIKTAVEDLLTDLKEGRFDAPKPAADDQTARAPWVQSGLKLQADIDASLSFEKQCAEKDDELSKMQAELAKQGLQFKDLEYKLALARKRDRTGKNETQMRIEAVRTEMAKQEDKLRLTIEAKTTEYKSLEEKCKEIEAELTFLKAKYSVNRPGSTAGISDLKAAALQIYTLREALRATRDELSKVRGKTVAESLAMLPALKADCLVPCDPARTKPIMSVDSSLYSLYGELAETMATPIVVDVTHSKKGGPSGKYQLSQAAARFHRLKTNGSANLRKMEVAFSQRRPGAFGSAAAGDTDHELQKALRDLAGGPAAVIKIPAAVAKSKGGTYKLGVGAAQFRSLHAEFVR
mmetsp:Transcript_30556/g.80018  ORF Transcript_30556/g.80018 Transcript_30556/m.80018 type:complete len:1146 (+) Transcript_30556:164-3601(+)